MKTIEAVVSTFSKNHQPCCTVKPGETLLFKTLDCYSGNIKTEADYPEDITDGDADLATGLVYVDGAEKGDVLVVDILDIDVADQGVCCNIGGPLMEQSVPRTKIIPVKNRIAHFNDIKWEVDPMLGVIGVAPEEGEPLCFLPGDHGGNMDSKMIKRGSRIYLPVQVPGALLGMGDVHASQGDCELCGNGIEIAADVRVKISLIKDFELHWPMTETKDKWYVNVAAPDYETALNQSCRELQRLMVDAYGWDQTDVFLYLSLQGDIEINQFTLPCPIDMILRAGVPKIPGKELIK
ncbi:acetamidase/formamidase family protein [Eubacteriales bacterium DFI.9.88]|nr:acetamidase/formamidase family protein [Eubacteriales bacterium DFI.9.88]